MIFFFNCGLLLLGIAFEGRGTNKATRDAETTREGFRRTRIRFNRARTHGAFSANADSEKEKRSFQKEQIEIDEKRCHKTKY